MKKLGMGQENRGVGPMMRIVSLFGVFSILIFNHAALADADSGGFYVGVKATGSAAKMGSIDVDGFTGSRTLQNDSDLTIGAGAVVGYRWADVPLRTELEGGYRFRFDLDVQDSGPPIIDYASNVATTTLLFNLLFEWRNQSDFTPFIGGSVGWARHSTETDREVTTTNVKASQTEHSDNLAWGAMAGVSWDFLEHWSAELAYRFTDLGEVETGKFSAGDSVSAEHYYAHDVIFMIKYRF